MQRLHVFCCPPHNSSYFGLYHSPVLLIRTINLFQNLMRVAKEGSCRRDSILPPEMKQRSQRREESPVLLYVSLPRLMELVVSGILPFTFSTLCILVAAVSSSVLRGPLPVPSLLSLLLQPVVTAAINAKRKNVFFITEFKGLR